MARTWGITECHGRMNGPATGVLSIRVRADASIDSDCGLQSWPSQTELSWCACAVLCIFCLAWREVASCGQRACLKVADGWLVRSSLGVAHPFCFCLFVAPHVRVPLRSSVYFSVPQIVAAAFQFRTRHYHCDLRSS